MQFTEADMQSEVRNLLRRWYPQQRGWKIYDQDEWTGIRPNFVIERRMNDSAERSICEIKVVRRVTNDHIEQVRHYAEALSGENISILEKILAVPHGTDISLIPRDISVMVVKNFHIE